MSLGLKLFIGIFLILLLAALFVLLIYWQGLSNAVISYCFKRSSEEKWQRGGCSNPSDRNLFRMWEDGTAWATENREQKSELETYNDKERLAAQYFDFGNDKAVIIVPGMYENCMYSYYYAAPWKEAGFNCLLVDNRATGRSGGDYNTIGFYESGDLLRWAAFLYERHNIKRIVIHGISMGAATGLLALNLPDCPAYVSGIVCDEAYFRFDDFFRNFMIKKRYNVKVLKTVLKKLHRVTGADPLTVAPVSFIDRIEVPVLFLAGKNDELVSKEQTQEMFDACGTSCGNKNKELIWFDYGEHSFIRLCDKEAYDAAIKKFAADMLPA